LPSYVFVDNAIATGLDLREGKWLLNEIVDPTTTSNAAKNLIVKKLGNRLGNRLTYTNDSKGLLLPKNVKSNPTKENIRDLKKGSGFDFFINVKIILKNNSLSDLDLTNNKFNKNLSKSVEVLFEVYDLNGIAITYSKKVIGSVGIAENNNSDINFSKSTSKLVLGCLNKIIRDIEKKSIK
jgi:hypothetical protein